MRTVSLKEVRFVQDMSCGTQSQTLSFHHISTSLITPETYCVGKIATVWKDCQKQGLETTRPVNGAL